MSLNGPDQPVSLPHLTAARVTQFASAGQRFGIACCDDLGNLRKSALYVEAVNPVLEHPRAISLWRIAYMTIQMPRKPWTGARSKVRFPPKADIRHPSERTKSRCVRALANCATAQPLPPHASQNRAEGDDRAALVDVVEEVTLVAVHLVVAPSCTEGHLAADLVIDGRRQLPSNL